MNLDRLSRWFPFLLLAAVAALTFWLDQVVRLPSSFTGKTVRQDPDYIVDRLTAVKMNAAGNVGYTLYADRLTHFPADDRTQLESPRFVSLLDGGAPITVTARQAQLSANGENVYFEHNVRVVRDPTPTQTRMVLETEFLHVIPDAHLVRTDRAVRLTDAHTVVEAVGLELNSETRVLKLLSTVKGVYHDPDRAARGR
jgi:lipopolysaccharide export system protein LptC